jgi:hypothetical protein
LLLYRYYHRMNYRNACILVPISILVGCQDMTPRSDPISSSFSLSPDKALSDLRSIMKKYLELKQYTKGDAFLNWDNMYQPGLDWARSGGQYVSDTPHLKDETIKAIGHTILEIGEFLNTRQTSVQRRTVLGLPALLTVLRLESIFSNPPSGFSQHDLGVLAKDAETLVQDVMRMHIQFTLPNSFSGTCVQMKSHMHWSKNDCKELLMKLDIATPIIRNACVRRYDTLKICDDLITSFRMFIYQRVGPPEYVASVDESYDAFIEAIDIAISKPIPGSMSLNDWEKKMSELINKANSVTNLVGWKTENRNKQSL